jgi:hypothetical protein
MSINLEDDLYRRLEAEARESGRSLNDVFVEVLRRGFGQETSLPLSPPKAPPPTPYRVQAKAMGLRPGFSLECVSTLIEHLGCLEEHEHRDSGDDHD